MNAAWNIDIKDNLDIFVFKNSKDVLKKSRELTKHIYNECKA